MKIVMLSKALVSGAYQKKLEELARIPDVSLVACVPPVWREPMAGAIQLERQFTEGYRLEVLPLALNGQHHLYWFRGLARLLARERPDVLHIDEESFNFATFLALRAGIAVGARCCFYNWANMDRVYPPPFGWFERYSFRNAAYGIAGNQEAAAILRRHGYHGSIQILPQFGVDPDLFSPKSATREHAPSSNRFVIGYMGRLIAWKGILDLLEALVGLPEHVHLRFVGDGDLRSHIPQHAESLGIRQRVEIKPAVKSVQVPAELHHMDVLVLPSRTQRTWKEQFGRILIEAMSCEVPVVGSSSGEIPHVIGDAGLVFPEGDVAALRSTLEKLISDTTLRHSLAQKGRQRVLQHYTQAALAKSYYAIYQEMVTQ